MTTIFQVELPLSTILSLHSCIYRDHCLCPHFAASYKVEMITSPHFVLNLSHSRSPYGQISSPYNLTVMY